MDFPVRPADFWTKALEGPVDDLTQAQLCDVAAAALAARHALDKALPAELIPSPVINLLLTLFTSGKVGAPIGNERLAEATTVGRTVAERYLQALDRYGFVRYDGDGETSALTEKGAERVRDALREIVRSQIELNAAIAARTAS